MFALTFTRCCHLRLDVFILLLYFIPANFAKESDRLKKSVGGRRCVISAL